MKICLHHSVVPTSLLPYLSVAEAAHHQDYPPPHHQHIRPPHAHCVSHAHCVLGVDADPEEWKKMPLSSNVVHHLTPRCKSDLVVSSAQAAEKPPTREPSLRKTQRRRHNKEGEGGWRHTIVDISVPVPGGGGGG